LKGNVAVAWKLESLYKEVEANCLLVFRFKRAVAKTLAEGRFSNRSIANDDHFELLEVGFLIAV
jgi:hypothetical protein